MKNTPERREQLRAAQARYRETHPERVRDYQAGYYVKQRAEHPEKTKARIDANNALRAGRLVKGPCEHEDAECSGRIEMHHDDYSKPYEVRWFCSLHHKPFHYA